MKKNTIKLKIFKSNLIIIFSFAILVFIFFNFAIQSYLKTDILNQLKKISMKAQITIFKQDPNFFSINPPVVHFDKPDFKKNFLINENIQKNSTFRFYFKLNKSLKDPLSVLNAEYILFNKKNQLIDPIMKEDYISDELYRIIKSKINPNFYNPYNVNFNYNGKKYLAIITPVEKEKSFDLGSIVIYSNLEKIQQLQSHLNTILIIILIISSILISLISSKISKEISLPLTHLNHHILELAKRKFKARINLNTQDEFQELIQNINIMSEKLEYYDKAQKTFLENVSHEFRTPLMAIYSHAEGLHYDIISKKNACEIIMKESNKLTKLVTDLLYLSRLDSIKEDESKNPIDLYEFLKSCIKTVKNRHLKSDIEFKLFLPNKNIEFNAQDEQLFRAFENILSNGIRYSKSKIFIYVNLKKDFIEIQIKDDGPGFESDDVLHLFDRFYKGKNGNFGLGLSIAKSVIDKHNGSIKAFNNKNESGATFIINLPY